MSDLFLSGFLSGAMVVVMVVAALALGSTIVFICGLGGGMPRMPQAPDPLEGMR